MLKYSIATICMGGTLETKLAATAKAGFRAVEIFENDLTFFSGKPRDVRAMANDLGLEIVALQPVRDFEAMPEPMRTRNFERAVRKFNVMEELGTKLLCLCSNVSEEAIDEPSRAADDLGELADIARRRGFRIGYEALAWGRHVRDWQAAWDLVRRADRPNLGIVLDSFHACVNRNPIAPAMTSIAAMAELPPDRIALVQVADAPAISMDPLSLSRHHRCYPGQGDLPIDEFLDAITRAGYSGAISLEIFNDQFRGASAAAMAVDGMRSLQLCGERLANIRSARGDPPLSWVAALPRPPRIDGIEFVEFTASGADSQNLAGLLQGLGFSRVAHHRTKNVDLFRQNAINIVLNQESDGFAHSFNLMHGPSVCALAVRVDDAERAIERASALGSQTYYGRIGPGEALIPAVAGVERSLLYFVTAGAAGASIWEQDFVAQDVVATQPASAPGRLMCIDHLSNAVRRSEFLSWALFYKAVLGLEPEPQIEIADPYGAFYSRALRSPDSSVRIPLNVAEGGSTAVSRFIDAFGGAGVQHIAFATDDIFGCVEAARARGVRFLDIPENYYDDLATRYDLPPVLLGRMQDLGILYDRNKTGEFFHLYTRTYQDRFFFEIVERRDYDLFGAANTPVRLAAQARAQDLVTEVKLQFGG
jgi:4-hydroxyphenylpyruvate dioxygenase